MEARVWTRPFHKDGFGGVAKLSCVVVRARERAGGCA